MNEGRFLVALYCDDVRAEVGNKLTLVGCYGTDLLLNTFPIVLPKLAVYVRAYTPAEKPFQKLVIRLRQNDEQVIGELEFPSAQLAAEAQSNSSKHRWQIIQAVMFASPLLVQNPGFLRLDAETEDGPLIGSKLVIHAMENSPSSIAEVTRIEANPTTVPN
jgi:hypothetical protein